MDPTRPHRPVIHQGVKYNCRVFVYDGKIVLIRPKMALANDGNYRERRWFTPWSRPRELDSLDVPAGITAVTGQTRVPFGDAVIVTTDTTVGVELCEELFAPDRCVRAPLLDDAVYAGRAGPRRARSLTRSQPSIRSFAPSLPPLTALLRALVSRPALPSSRSPHVHLALNGVEIFSNGSGSHHELRKLNVRVSLITNATRKVRPGCSPSVCPFVPLAPSLSPFVPLALPCALPFPPPS